ncbi:MAG: preQ(1) synthase [Candidatus Omnitrophota bacterium]
MPSKNSYRDLQKDVRCLKMPKIDTWRNEYSDKDYLIDLEHPEFTCVCPKTGLPDFANLMLQYRPDELCVELKSLKMYLVSYRDIGIFHEHAVNKILDDFVKACKPRWAYIKGVFNTRGGITTTISSEFKGSKVC